MTWIRLYTITCMQQDIVHNGEECLSWRIGGAERGLVVVPVRGLRELVGFVPKRFVGITIVDGYRVIQAFFICTGTCRETFAGTCDFEQGLRTFAGTYRGTCPGTKVFFSS